MLEIHREIDGILTLNLQKNTVKIQLYKNICILKSKKKKLSSFETASFLFQIIIFINARKFTWLKNYSILSDVFFFFFLVKYKDKNTTKSKNGHTLISHNPKPGIQLTLLFNEFFTLSP